MKIKEFKETREVVVRTDYIAMDGKIFGTKEECEKYEKTCQCVLMTDYNRLVKGNISEYDLFYENGCNEYSYDIVEVQTEADREIVNRVLIYGDKNSKLIESPGMYLIWKNPYEEPEITGHWTTIDKILTEIKRVYDKTLEESKVSKE